MAVGKTRKSLLPHPSRTRRLRQGRRLTRQMRRLHRTPRASLLPHPLPDRTRRPHPTSRMRRELPEPGRRRPSVARRQGEPGTRPTAVGKTRKSLLPHPSRMRRLPCRTRSPISARRTPRPVPRRPLQSETTPTGPRLRQKGSAKSCRRPGRRHGANRPRRCRERRRKRARGETGSRSRSEVERKNPPRSRPAIPGGRPEYRTRCGNRMRQVAGGTRASRSLRAGARREAHS
jgi:hypothetical protein